jgi:hypothetical protein
MTGKKPKTEKPKSITTQTIAMEQCDKPCSASVQDRCWQDQRQNKGPNQAEAQNRRNLI